MQEDTEHQRDALIQSSIDLQGVNAEIQKAIDYLTKSSGTPAVAPVAEARTVPAGNFRAPYKAALDTLIDAGMCKKCETVRSTLELAWTICADRASENNNPTLWRALSWQLSEALNSFEIVQRQKDDATEVLHGALHA